MASFTAPQPDHPMDNRPDTYYNGYYGKSDIDLLSKFVGAPKYNWVKDGAKITSQTLAELFNGPVEEPTKIVHMKVITIESWHTIFAPLERSSMNKTYETEIWEQPTLEQAPEDLPPPVFKYKTQSHTWNMDRAHLGAEMRQDFFKLPNGKDIMQKSLRVIIQATWIYMKLQVLSAVFNSKQFWAQYHRDKGQEYPNQIVASDVERKLFGILNRNPKGLSEILMIARQIVSPEGIPLPMLVVPESTLDLISTHDFWTESFRSSKDIALKVLSMNGRALTGVFGTDIYEDPAWNVSNLHHKDVQQLVSRKTIGMFFVTDNSKVKHVRDCDDYDSAMAEEIPSMDVNDWKLQKMIHIAKHSGVWAPDGTLSKIHDYMLNNLETLLERTGIEIHDDLVDPYIWKSEAYGNGEANPVGRGFKKIEEYGSAELAYWTLEKNIESARKWKDSVVEPKLGTDGIRAVNRYQQLCDTLSSFDPLDANIQAYAFAIVANRDNVTSSTVDYTESNRFGFSQPPRTKELTMDNGSKKTVMYITGSDGKERYIYYALSNDVVKTGEMTIPRGMPIAFAAAPLESDLNAITGLGNTIPTTWILATAPKTLYGFGTPPGMSTIKDLSESNDSHGWTEVDKDTLDRAPKMVNAVNDLTDLLKSAIPRDHYWKQEYMPTYLKSGDPNVDAYNCAATNLLKKVRMPLMVRKPTFTQDDDAFIITTSISNQREFSIDPDSVVPIATDMGFDEKGTSPSPHVLPFVDKDGKQLISQADQTKIGASLVLILDSIYLDPNAKAGLVDPDTRKKAFDFYLKNLGPQYAAAYKDDTGEKTGPSFAHFYFNEIVKKVDIEDPESIEKAARVLGGVFNLAKNRKNQTTLTPYYIDTLRNTQVASREGNMGKRKGYDLETKAKKDIESAEGKSPVYINIRLVSDPIMWERIEAKVASLPSTDPYVAKANFGIIRKSNPDNPTKALGPQVPEDEFANRAKKSIKTWQYARAKTPGGRGGSRDDLSSLGFFAYPGLYSKAAERDELYHDTELTGFSSKTSRVPKSMYGTPDAPMYSSVSYEDQFGNIVYPQGQPAFVEKTNLIRRLNAIEKDESQDNITRMIAQTMAMAEVHFDNYCAMLKKKMTPQFGCYVHAMQRCVFNMGHALAANPGSETAIIGHNFEDVIFQLDGASRTWHLNYSNWIGCLIKKHQNFLIMPSISFKGYVAGYNDIPISTPRDFDYSNLPDLPTKGIFHFDCGGNFTRQDIQEPLSMTFKPEPAYSDYKVATPQNPTKQQIPSGLKYLCMYGFDLMNNATVLDKETFKKELDSTHYNTELWSGSQRSYNPSTGKHDILHIGRSHVAEILPPDALSIFKGTSTFKTVPLSQQH